MKMVKLFIIALFIPALCSAHDTWIHVDTPVVRVGDTAHINLMLGNHGNGHRDFKLASKISPEGWTFSVLRPDGSATDLRPNLIDMGYAPKEGFWTGRFVANQPGLHLVTHTLDKLHGKIRAIKSSKSFLLSSESLDNLSPNQFDFSRRLDLPLELILLVDPIRDIQPGKPVVVQVLYQGKPLPKTRVSFIPRGAALSQEFDDRFERLTDNEGKATFSPSEANWMLVVVHHSAPEQKGEGFESTAYSATMTLQITSIPRLRLTTSSNNSAQ